MQQHGSKYFYLQTPHPHPTLRGGSKLTLPEHGHVEYQIKSDHLYSNMVANILPADPPPPPHTHTHTHLCELSAEISSFTFPENHKICCLIGVLKVNVA